MARYSVETTATSGGSLDQASPQTPYSERPSVDSRFTTVPSEEVDTLHEKRSFPPVVDQGTRVLILGSLPGEISLARGQYYANPLNQFWRLVGEVTGTPLPPGYEARLDALRQVGIGLWDVVKSARRRGSLDAAITGHVANPLAELAESLPGLQAIGFNGGTSSRIGRAQLTGRTTAALVDLPSSSPAYTLPFERKLAAWRQLRPFLAL